jgi:hypothetical protein
VREIKAQSNTDVSSKVVHRIRPVTGAGQARDRKMGAAQYKCSYTLVSKCKKLTSASEMFNEKLA